MMSQQGSNAGSENTHLGHSAANEALHTGEGVLTGMQLVAIGSVSVQGDRGEWHGEIRGLEKLDKPLIDSTPKK